MQHTTCGELYSSQAVIDNAISQRLDNFVFGMSSLAKRVAGVDLARTPVEYITGVEIIVLQHATRPR